MTDSTIPTWKTPNKSHKATLKLHWRPLHHLLPKESKRSSLNVRKHYSMRFRNLLKISQFHRFKGHISSNSFISLIKIRSYIHSNDSFQGRMVLSVDDWDNIHHLAIWTAIFCLLRMILKEVNVFYNKFTKYHPFRQNSRAKLMHVLAKLITTKDSNKISFSLGLRFLSQWTNRKRFGFWQR